MTDAALAPAPDAAPADAAPAAAPAADSIAALLAGDKAPAAAPDPAVTPEPRSPDQTVQTAAEDAANAAAVQAFADSIKDPKLKEYVTRKGFKDAEALAASYASLEGLASDQTKRVLLPTGPDDKEGIDRVYTALGRPATPDDYGLTELQGADPEFAGKMAGWLHKLGGNKEAVTELAGEWNKYVADRAAAEDAAFKQQSQADWTALRTEWGGEFPANAEAFRRAAQTFGLSEEDIGAIEGAKGTRWTVNLLSKIGKGLGEDTFIEGEGQRGFGLSVEAANTRLAALKTDKAWMARYLAGESGPVEEWNRINAVIASSMGG